MRFIILVMIILVSMQSFIHAENNRKGQTPVTDKSREQIINGVGKLKWNDNRDNSFIGALTATAQAMGNKVTYDYVMGVSGASFKLTVIDCPSCEDATCGIDCSIPAAKALGYKMSSLFCDPKKPDEVEKARQAIVKSIDQGYPVLALDLAVCAEWGVISGYKNDGNELLCRTYFDQMEDYRKAEKWPWGLYFITVKQNPPSKKDNVLKSLEIAGQIARTEKSDGYFCGFAAYNEWCRMLGDESWGKLSNDGKSSLLNLNAICYRILLDARKSAVTYLLSVKDELGLNCSKHLLKASDLYEKETKLLVNMRKQMIIPWEDKTKEPWSDKNRHAQIEVLKQSLELERKAVEQLDLAIHTYNR